MSANELRVNRLVVVDDRKRDYQAVVGGAVGEVMAAIASLDARRAAVVTAGERAERRWNMAVLVPEENAARAARDDALRLQANPFTKSGGPAAALRALYEQAQRGDETRRLAWAKVMRYTQLDGGEQSERIAVESLARRAERDLNRLQVTQQMEQAAAAVDDAERVVFEKKIQLSYAAQALGEDPPDFIMNTGQLAKAWRMVGIGDDGHVVINAENSAAVTGVEWHDQDVAAMMQGG